MPIRYLAVARPRLTAKWRVTRPFARISRVKKGTLNILCQHGNGSDASFLPALATGWRFFCPSVIYFQIARYMAALWQVDRDPLF
jgi:hypothetical protein